MVHQLESRILEHFLSFHPVGGQYIQGLLLMESPLPFSIKLNVDAAVNSSSSSIAVVARNSEGLILKCWSKNVPFVEPCIAEAAAIAWALLEHYCGRRRESLHWCHLGFFPVKTPWKIHTFVANVSSLVFNFNSCRFCWVGREANMVAHSLANFGSHLAVSFSCNISNLPPSVHTAWIRDLSFSSW